MGSIPICGRACEFVIANRSCERSERLAKVAEPHFRELEPDVELVATDRRASWHGVMPRDDCADFP